MTRAHRLSDLQFVFLGFASLATSCAHRPPSLNPLEGLPGYGYAFPVPRNDYEPGTVIVRWDKPAGKINVVCRGRDYMPPNGPPVGNANHALDVTDEQKRALK